MNMRKSMLAMSTLAVAAVAVAGLPRVIRTTTLSPQVKQPTIERRAMPAARPVLAPRAAQGTLQAAFSIQGTSSQQTVWSENFDTGAAGWTLGRDGENYFGWELKKSTGSYAYSVIDPDDAQSLFIEGPYQTWRRNIAHATSTAIDVPANGALHAHVGYSQNMNDYAVLTITASTDDFATSTTLWSSDQETGEVSWRWHALELPLDGLAGQTVRLRFTYGPGLKDAFGTGGYMADFYVDGLRVTGVDEIDHIDVKTGEQVQFVDLSSGDVTAWQWTLDGGTPATSSDPAPTVYYTRDGNYDVTLTVTDAQGKTSTVTKPGFVRVTGDAPVARILPPATFRYDETHLPMVCPLVPVQYADASSGFPTQWQWNFTATDPATSTEQAPTVAYHHMYEQSVTLDVANEHGASRDSIGVSVEYEGYISNLLPEDYPVTYDLDGEGTFPGCNRMKINAYGERFGKPSRPILVYGALVFFETASAQALTDQIANIGVHLYTSKDGLPDQRRESMWWRVVDLYTNTSTTLRGTMFEFDPQVVDEEFFITVDGIPEWNDSCDVSFAMAALRDHDNTAYMQVRDQWRPVAGYFDRERSHTSFYIMPLVAHSVITLLPVGTDQVELPAQGGQVEQQIFSLFGYDLPETGVDWLRFEGAPNDITLDTLRVTCDPLPAGMTSREAIVTFTDRIQASSIQVRFVQRAGQAPLRGDVNGDGVVDIVDVNTIINVMLGKTVRDEVRAASDVTGDGQVDIVDANLVINLMLGKASSGI